jgi:hypothetical protein
VPGHFHPKRCLQGVKYFIVVSGTHSADTYPENRGRRRGAGVQPGADRAGSNVGQTAGD